MHVIGLMHVTRCAGTYHVVDGVPMMLSSGVSHLDHREEEVPWLPLRCGPWLGRSSRPAV